MARSPEKAARVMAFRASTSSLRRIIVDQAGGVDRAFRRPVLLVFRQAQILERHRNADVLEQPGHFIDQPVGQFLVGAGKADGAADLRERGDAIGAVELHHIGHQQGHAHAVRRVGLIAYRILDGVRRGRACGAEGAAGGQRGQHHLLARLDILAILHGGAQRLEDVLQAPSRPNVSLSTFLPTNTFFTVRSGVTWRARGGVAFDGMGQRVGAADRGQARRAGQGQFRIAHGRARDQIRAGNAYLGAAFGVGDHRHRGHFRTGA